jgi:enoyl-CoA hydratase/carnithine racemase
MTCMHYEKDADGIVTVTMDMSGPVNAMNEEFRNDFGEVVDRSKAGGRADGRGDRLGQESVLRRR